MVQIRLRDPQNLKATKPLKGTEWHLVVADEEDRLPRGDGGRRFSGGDESPPLGCSILSITAFELPRRVVLSVNQLSAISAGT